MRTHWITWIWPTFILLSTLAVALITFLFPGIGARPIVIMCFLFVIPGMTVVRFFRLNELAIEWMLAIVLSFTIDAFVAGIVLYAGQWSPKNIISFLLGFCFSGAIAQLVIIRPVSVLAQPLPSEHEDSEETLDLAQSLSLQDEVTLDLNQPLRSHDEDAEITKERPAVSSQLYQSIREKTEEKTVSL